MDSESRLINYWAHMLDESSGVNLANVEGSMTKVINDQIMDKLETCKTVQQVYDLVKNAFDANGIDTTASRRLLYHIQRSRGVMNAMMAVHNSRMAGMNLGVNGPRRRRIYEKNSETIHEAKHSMHGPAWASKTGGVDEIADMREKLANGVVEFTFWKHGENGQGDVQRRAVGTTSEQVMPVSTRRELDPNYDENVASYERRSGFIIWFWDLEKDAARCFNTNRFDEIVNYVPTTTRYDDEDSIGPIEVNKFVDDFDMP